MTAPPPNHKHRVVQLLSPRHFVRAASHFWSSDVNSAAVELLAPQNGQHILDLGAGVGPATIYAAGRVGPTGTVVAVDPSMAMRTLLRIRRLFQATRSQITIYKGTGEDLPLPDTSIDAAMALNVMHHLRDLEATARELARTIKPTGRLVLVDEDFGHPDHTFYDPNEPDDHRPEFVDLNHMSELLIGAGFIDTAARNTRVGTQPAYVITATRGNGH